MAADTQSAGATDSESGSTSFEPVWGNIESLRGFSPATGVWMQSITGEKLMLNFVSMEPNAVVPLHNHIHEQCGTVLKGTIRLTIGGDTRDLTFGDAYVIPPNVIHGATTD